MINLLHATPSESEIAAILAETAGHPALPPLGAPAWAAARAHPAVDAWVEPLLARVDRDIAEPMPVLTPELYADFFKTGNRLPFEELYFERRRRLGRVAMGLLLGDDADRPRHLSSFIEKLASIADEESWALPAHVWTEPTGKNPWMIDLFAAETANQLADLLVVFAAVIPADLAHRIKTRLHDQIFENYVAPRAAFTWLQITNNWNAVCHQGVLGAALAIEEDHALVARMLKLAAGRLPVFLSGFGNDGSTSEGPGYWSYGFGWFSELNAQLEHRTRGQLSLFEGDAKVAVIARFAPLMTLSEGNLVNFSDGSRTGYLSPSLLVYLGGRLAAPVLSAQGAALYHRLSKTGIPFDELRCDFFQLTRLVLRIPAATTLEHTREIIQPDAYFPDYGALVARGKDTRGHRWEFAAKAGHNHEHHNHNDCGSFILNVDGAPALVEIGAPEYTRAYFGEQRYDNIAARSLGHSVPLVNGYEQAAGPAFTSTVLRAESGGDRVEFVIDLTRAYPSAARLRSLHRTFVFEKSAGRLTVTDRFALDSPGLAETLLITESTVTRDGETALITTSTANLRVTPTEGARIAALETIPYRGHQGTDERIHRIRLTPSTATASDAVIGFTITAT